MGTRGPIRIRDQWVTVEMMYYLAGFIDGEGCFRYNGTTNASVINSYPWPLHILKDLFGGSIRAKPKSKEEHKRVYEWEVSGDNARYYAAKVRPFLREKWRQADLVTRIMDEPKGSPARDELDRQLRELKHFEYEAGV